MGKILLWLIDYIFITTVLSITVPRNKLGRVIKMGSLVVLMEFVMDLYHCVYSTLFYSFGGIYKDQHIYNSNITFCY